ncbi:NEAT domain-containing protein [Streptococcus gallolyticus subsp. gallolyticus]|uniref:NEAT domain-containing protein n=1 Tax=Streptococcus gallolyticus TaxID=315405 RepID=UPI00228490D6|nr:NEAT domain-containing protein [Streptococcus gallolyticus]MCY7172548.1 NEAT domain-containing protein [Streptococcus gallolyticus subsp. gallolyticus]
MKYKSIKTVLACVNVCGTMLFANQAYAATNYNATVSVLDASQISSSRVQNYISNARVVQEDDGNYYVYFELSNEEYFAAFTVNGIQIENVSDATYKFAYTPGVSTYPATVHITIPEYNYDGTYTVYINVTGVDITADSSKTTDTNAQTSELENSVDEETISSEQTNSEEVTAPETTEVEESNQVETESQAPTTEKVYLLHATQANTYSSMQNYITGEVVINGDGTATLTFVKTTGITAFYVNGEQVTINEDGTATFAYDPEVSDYTVQFDVTVGPYSNSYVLPMHIGTLAEEPAAATHGGGSSTTTVTSTDTSSSVISTNLENQNTSDDTEATAADELLSSISQVNDEAVTVAVYKDGTSEISHMNSYVDAAAVIKTIDNQRYVYMTIKKSSWWQEFTIEGANVETVSYDTETDEKVVRFPYIEGQTTYNANVHIVVSTIGYDETYATQIVVSPVESSTETNDDKASSTSGNEDSGDTTDSLANDSDNTTESDNTTAATPEKVYLLHATQANTYSSMQNYITGEVVINGDGTATLTFVKTTGITAFYVNGEQVTINEDGTATFAYDPEVSDYTVQFDVTVGPYSNSYGLPMHIGALAEEPAVATHGGGSSASSDSDDKGTSDSGSTSTDNDNNANDDNGGVAQSQAITIAVYKDGTSEMSYMDSYVNGDAEIVTIDGQKYVQMTITHATWWQSFSVDGVAVETVSYDTATDTKVVRFKYVEGQTTYNADVHIIVSAIGYDETYATQIVVSPKAVNPSATSENNTTGNKQGGNSSNVASSAGTTPTLLTNVGNLSASPASSSVSSDTQSVRISVFKNNSSETSVMAQYVLGTGQIVTVNGQKYVQMTITHASWWQSFMVNGTAVTVVSYNAATDYSVIRFPYIEGQTTYTAVVHIVASEYDYDNTYTTIIAISTSGASNATGGSGTTSIEASGATTTGLKTSSSTSDSSTSNNTSDKSDDETNKKKSSAKSSSNHSDKTDDSDSNETFLTSSASELTNNRSTVTVVLAIVAVLLAAGLGFLSVKKRHK